MRRLMSRMVFPAVIAALLAVVLPAAASAATLKDESGSLVPPGTTLEVNLDQLEFNSVTGWSDCAAGAKPLTMVATENNGSEIEAEEEYGSASSSCHLSGTLHAATEAMNIKMSNLKAEGAEGTGTISLSFEAHPTGRIGNCLWTNPNLPISFAGGTNTFTAVSRWPNSSEEWETNCGEMEFEGEFSLTDSKGGKVLLGREMPPPHAVFVSEGATVHMALPGGVEISTDYAGIECYGGSGDVSLTGETSQLEFGYSPAECEIPVRTNGCGFKFRAGTPEGEGSSGSADIVCPVGKQIEVENSPSSIVLIPAQSPTHGVTYVNRPESVQAIVSLTNLMYYLKGTKEYRYNGTLESVPVVFSAQNSKKEPANFYVE